MSSLTTQPNSGQGIVLSIEQIKLLSDAGIIPADAPPEQVALFAKRCEAMGVNPLLPNKMYLIRYASTWYTVVGISQLAAIAARTGSFAGNDPVVYNDGIPAHQLGTTPPFSATATVYRFVQGVRCAFTQTALYNECVKYRGGTREPTQMWKERPASMLAKCAFAAALRFAFPEETGGLYTREEMSGESHDGNNNAAPVVTADAMEVRDWNAEIEATPDIDALASLAAQMGNAAKSYKAELAKKKDAFIEDAKAKIAHCQTVEELEMLQSLQAAYSARPDFAALFNAAKAALTLAE